MSRFLWFTTGMNSTQPWQRVSPTVVTSASPEWCGGEGWAEIRKEWYADGPSLFTYRVTINGITVEKDFLTLRSAKAHVEQHFAR